MKNIIKILCFRNYIICLKRKKIETLIMEKKYPSLVLGLDISTACIGASIVFDDGISKPEIIKLTHIVPKIDKNIKGIEALILRKQIFEEEFLMKIKDMKITECVIESPLNFATGNSNAVTVAQLLQFNGLLSEAVYRVLGIVPNYISSFDARMRSFPELLSIRKFNKKGVEYPLSHIKKAINDNHLTLFGSYPFDCDKKIVMMNLVNEMFSDLNWVYDKKGNLKKENFDACDSLVCVLAYINEKKYGTMKPFIKDHTITETEEKIIIEYVMDVWETEYPKKIVLEK